METEFKKIQNKLLFIFYAILSCFLVFFVTSNFNSRIRYTIKHDQERMGKDTSNTWKQTLLENGQPLCDGKFLNRRNYSDINRTNKTSIEKGLCRLFPFNIDHAVTCLDQLYYQNQYFRGFTENETYGTFPSAELTFLFVGDSRVRQQFYNFLKGNCQFRSPFIDNRGRHRSPISPY
ncbi:hypothetical protein OUZ56_011806 [Daphnia magna]|uniref:Uncharacterized protein n=1 Tax=Daphnia magna TaxID=35525 RepID=A0ABQ9Z1G9_9CRUS|nr:hypothetical protein OUZ56_011806 [Daphnia magna]